MRILSLVFLASFLVTSVHAVDDKAKAIIERLNKLGHITIAVFEDRLVVGTNDDPEIKEFRIATRDITKDDSIPWLEDDKSLPKAGSFQILREKNQYGDREKWQAKDKDEEKIIADVKRWFIHQLHREILGARDKRIHSRLVRLELMDTMPGLDGPIVVYASNEGGQIFDGKDLPPEPEGVAPTETKGRHRGAK